LGNLSYAEKRETFALSHFELNRCFGNYERWTSVEVEHRAKALFKVATQLWPRPENVIAESSVLADKSAPAAFHGDCVKLVQQHLGIHLSKLSQTRYESGDGRVRLTCAVSAAHKESGDVPYFWFGLHIAQLEFLETAESPYICLGCSSPDTTLLVPLSALRNCLDLLSVTRTEDRQYWHIVIQKRLGRFVARLLGGKDGPDLTGFNIGPAAQVAVLP
jgi:hypothetical protein